MISVRRKGADYKVEEIFQKIRLEDNIAARDKAKADNPSGLIYRKDPFGSKKIVTMEDIQKQKAHLHGHPLKSGDYKLPCADYLAEIYNEYLRMYQLAYESAKEGKIMKSQTSGKPIMRITFDDWVWENKSVLIWRKQDLKRQFKTGKLSKEMFGFHEEIRRYCIEYCDRYIKATQRAKITMV